MAVDQSARDGALIDGVAAVNGYRISRWSLSRLFSFAFKCWPPMCVTDRRFYHAGTASAWIFINVGEKILHRRR